MTRAIYIAVYVFLYKGTTYLLQQEMRKNK